MGLPHYNKVESWEWPEKGEENDEKSAQERETQNRKMYNLRNLFWGLISENSGSIYTYVSHKM